MTCVCMYMYVCVWCCSGGSLRGLPHREEELDHSVGAETDDVTGAARARLLHTPLQRLHTLGPRCPVSELK